MKSVEHHGLPITRAIFMQGKSPYKFMPVLHMSLFLSANPTDVKEAMARNLPAGQSFPPSTRRMTQIPIFGSHLTSTAFLQMTHQSELCKPKDLIDSTPMRLLTRLHHTRLGLCMIS
jgi:hypothetical protein